MKSLPFATLCVTILFGCGLSFLQAKDKRIRDEDLRAGGSADAVRAEVWVSLNGRRSQLFLDPFVDLTRVDDGPWVARDWVLPQDSIVTMAEYHRVKEDWKLRAGW